MTTDQLLAYRNTAIERAQADSVVFGKLLTTISCFYNFSADNILALSEILEKPADACLKTAEEISALGKVPASEFSIDLFNTDLTGTVRYYDLNKYQTKKEQSESDSHTAENNSDGPDFDAWSRTMIGLFTKFSTGTEHIPGLFSRIIWKDIDDDMPKPCKIENGTLCIQVKKDDISQTFWAAITACLVSLFNRHSGFDAFTDEIKQELAGVISLVYLKQQNLSPHVRGLPEKYRKEYPSAEDFITYVDLIRSALILIAEDIKENSVKESENTEEPEESENTEEPEEILPADIPDGTYDPSDADDSTFS